MSSRENYRETLKQLPEDLDREIAIAFTDSTTEDVSSIILSILDVWPNSICCVDCDKKLFGYPKIHLEGQVYCFFCAKKEFRKLSEYSQSRADEYYDKLTEKYEDEKKDVQEKVRVWRSERSKYVAKSSRSAFGVIVLIVACGSIVTYTYFTWVETFFIFISSLFLGKKYIRSEQERIEKQFKKSNPSPYRGVERPLQPLPDVVAHRPLTNDDSPFIRSGYREAILKRDKHICQACGKRKHRMNLEVHHIIPRAQGGSNHPCNLVTLCLQCHDHEDWYGHVRRYPMSHRRRR